MLVFFSNFQKYWKLCVAAFFSLWMLQQHVHIAYLQQKLKQQETEKNVVKKANARLTVLINSQNEAVQALQSRSNQAGANAARAMLAAQKTIRNYQKKSQKILSYKADTNECGSIIKLINEAIK